MKNKFIVGTRGSTLAIIQTNMVIEAIKANYPGVEIEVKKIKTAGDKILDKSLSKIGGKGLFIAEIEEALKNGSIDFAVHSMKDVPNIVPEGFKILTALKREDPRDAVITRDGRKLSELPYGAVIGTSSLRRIAQIKEIRKDFNFKPLRGNVDTRINKLQNGEADAIILAAAGLKRMGLEHKISEYLDIHSCIPAVGQGALCIEINRDNKEVFNIVNTIEDASNYRCVAAERAFLKELEGGCSIAIGAHAAEKENIHLEGFVCGEDNITIYKAEETGRIDEFEQIGIKLAKKLKALKGSAAE